jgi:hypothetical protein
VPNGVSTAPDILQEEQVDLGWIEPEPPKAKGGKSIPAASAVESDVDAVVRLNSLAWSPFYYILIASLPTSTPSVPADLC